MDLIDILTFFHLDKMDFLDDPVIVKDQGRTIINLELVVDKERICPICNSRHVEINDHHTIKIKSNLVLAYQDQIEVHIRKAKYKCKDCGHKFYQKTDNIVRSKRHISNQTCWAVYALSKEIISFTSIAKILKISVPKVISIFDEIVRVDRKQLPECLAIDEKSFSTYCGKYICILSNAMTGEIIDILPGRTNDVLSSYFDNIDILERNNVHFITSDMFQGYKTVCKKYFPKAIHIIDHFHVKKLFTTAINTIRTGYLKQLNKDTDLYRFTKSYWQTFLVDKYKERKKKDIKPKWFTDDNGVKVTHSEMKRRVLKDSDELNEIVGLYDDFNNYMDYSLSDEKLDQTLDFLIRKCQASTIPQINTIGETFSDFYQELKNTYGLGNEYQLTNSVAEGNNSFISKILAVSYGNKDFIRLRKRIFHIKG